MVSISVYSPNPEVVGEVALVKNKMYRCGRCFQIAECTGIVVVRSGKRGTDNKVTLTS